MYICAYARECIKPDCRHKKPHTREVYGDGNDCTNDPCLVKDGPYYCVIEKVWDE